MTQTQVVKAKKIRADGGMHGGAGDFLPGLDNGYVVEVERTGYSGSMVRITFHTTEGEEAYVECPDNMPITIKARK